MHTWHWHTWQGLPYLTCSLLRPWAHGFFTANFWPQPPEVLVKALAEEAAVHRIRQVHGNTVLNPAAIPAIANPSPPELTDNFSPSDADADTSGVETVASSPSPQPSPTVATELPPADGLVTDGPDQAIWVCSADCNPVLIGDVTTGQTAAIHAGWRGTALQIVPQAIRKMQHMGSRPEDLRVAMGPAISGEVYQVSTHVAAEVGRTLTDASFETEAALIEYLQNQDNLVIFPDPEPGRVRLDVRQVNAMQLAALGISTDQVAIAPHCTYQEPEHFFSYRRTREKKVQWSGIVSQSGVMPLED